MGWYHSIIRDPRGIEADVNCKTSSRSEILGVPLNVIIG